MPRSAMRVLTILMLVTGVVGCGEPADFVDVAGQGHRYSELGEHHIVVNYWATWCGPCIKEIPELNALAAEHADTLVVLGVNYDQPVGEEMAAQVRKMKIEFPVYQQDPAERLGVETPQVLPTTFIFGPGLELRDTLVGPQTAESILAVIEANPG